MPPIGHLKSVVGVLVQPRSYGLVRVGREECIRGVRFDQGAFGNLGSAARQRPETADVKGAVAIAQHVIWPYVSWLALKGRSNRQRRPKTSWPTATTEEQQVTEMLAAGLSSVQVGKRLGKPPNTVYVQLRSLRLKLSAANNDQFLRFAREGGMLPRAVGLREGRGRRRRGVFRRRRWHGGRRSDDRAARVLPRGIGSMRLDGAGSVALCSQLW